MLEAGSLWRLVERRAEETPNALFAVDESNRRLDFARYRDAALRCAAALHARGVAAGDAVSWQLPTTLESMVLVGALARLGARQNPILPIYRRREVAFAVEQSDASLLAVPGVFRGFDHGAMAREIAADKAGLDVLVVDGALPDADPTWLPDPPSLTTADASPVRWLFYTSGTTADPKGALHTDHCLMSTGRALCRSLDLCGEDRVAMVFPFTHIGGLGWFSAGLAVGCGHVVVPVFDPDSSIAVLARHGVTQAGAGTAFHQAYLAAQRARGKSPVFPEVRAFPGGGAPKPPQLHFDVKREMGGAGIVSGYGMTECPIISMNRIDDPDEKLAHTEGRPSEGMRVRVVTRDGRTAAPGEDGEIRACGPQLCRGYLDSSLDAEAFDDEGLFRSGDLGHIDDDGFLVITGRLKDVIIRKGENVSAREIEDALYRHPKVADVGVIGLPDAERGERVCAVVACERAEEPLTFDDMVSFLRGEGLMTQKIPEQLEILADLPRNPTGKVLKQELRRRFST